LIKSHSKPIKTLLYIDNNTILTDGLIKFIDLENLKSFNNLDVINMELWISVKSMRKYETKRLFSLL